MSQEALARRSDMSLNGFADIERGKIKNPHYSTLRKIAGSLGVSVAELLGEETEGAPLAEAPSASPERGGAKPEEAGLTDEYLRHIANLGDATYHPVAVSTIALVFGVCDGVEYRVEQEEYSLKAAMHDRVEVLEALELVRVLQRKDDAATPRQREALDRVEDRLKAVRKQVTEAFERLWNTEPDPEKVISLEDRRKVEELEQSVGVA